METPRFVPTVALHNSLRKGAACALNLQPQIEYLEELAKALPELDQDITALRLKVEHLDRACKVGLKGVAASMTQNDGQSQ